MLLISSREPCGFSRALCTAATPALCIFCIPPALSITPRTLPSRLDTAFDASCFCSVDMPVMWGASERLGLYWQISPEIDAVKIGFCDAFAGLGGSWVFVAGRC